MSTCRFTILSYHRSETAGSGLPLLLLFEYAGKPGAGETEIYLLSNLSDLLKDLPFVIHDWMVSALIEISKNKRSLGDSASEFSDQYGSLNVGPLRTERSGSFSSDSRPSSLAAIQEQCGLVPLRAEPEWEFPDILMPLDYALLPLMRQEPCDYSDEALGSRMEEINLLNGTAH